MRVCVILVALGCLASVPGVAAEQHSMDAQFTLYEAPGVQLVPPGTVEPVQLLRSTKVHVGELLEAAFPDLDLKLRTFPMFRLESRTTRSLRFSDWGYAVFLYEDTAAPLPTVMFSLTVDETQFPPVVSLVSPTGGSAFVVIGGEGTTYFACMDVWQGE